MTSAEVVTRFYSAFQSKDYKTMQSLYSDTATFSDPVFTNLSAPGVRDMWEMLVRNGKDLQIEFKVLDSSAEEARAEWVATYTFSRTGKNVVNRINADFIIRDGLIIRHTDRFSFYRWSSQALGFTGILFGWTSWLKKKVRSSANTSLQRFISERG